MVARLPGDGSLFPGRDPAFLLYDEVKSRVTSQDFETWFAQTPCSFQAPDRFVLTAPNRFRRAWMEKNYGELLRSCARNVFEHDVQVDFLVQDQESSPDPLPVSPEGGTSDQQSGKPERTGIPVTGSLGNPQIALNPGKNRENERSRRFAPSSAARPSLKPEFTFENYVVGPSNRVAQAAARAVSDAPAKSYNPLFLHGDPGVGKTHLLHAICHRILTTTRLRVTYLSSSDLQHSRGASSSPLLSVPSKDVDVLVVDDLQFLSAKESIQTGLFHALNTLLEENKQVILASRSHPRDTKKIHERLASRFQWGLIAHLQPPTFNTRVDILLRKAHLRNCELPLEVAEFLADRIRDNPRELEGALIQAVTFATFHSTPLDLATAHLALDSLLAGSRPTGTVTVAQILQSVQEYYQIKPKDLLSRSKVRSLVFARQVGMYLARQLTPLSLQEIGMHFGGRDHTTVLYSTDRISKLLKTHAHVRTDYQTLKSRVLSLRPY